MMPMASLQISNSAFSQFVNSGSNFPGKLRLGFRRKVRVSSGSWRYFLSTRLRICWARQDGDKQSNGEEPPESLFMKELRRRGMNPNSLLEDTKRSNYGLDDELKVEEDKGFSNRNAVSTKLEKGLDNQRERSMALNKEGLEGLVPRAKVLLTIGGTFFLGFGPLILITVAFFSALYLYFGPLFVHDASKVSISPPEYINPYTLLEDERMARVSPPVY